MRSIFFIILLASTAFAGQSVTVTRVEDAPSTVSVIVDRPSTVTVTLDWADTPTPTPTASPTATATPTPEPTPSPTPTLYHVELYTSATVEQWNITNFAGISQNYITAGNNTLYQNATRGNVATLAGLRYDRYVYNNTTYTSQTWINSGIVNCAQLFRCDLSQVPSNLHITRAYLGFNGSGYAEGGAHPTGVEGVSIRQILNSLNQPRPWRNSYLWRAQTSSTDEAAWTGASWGFSQKDYPTTTTKKRWTFTNPNNGVKTNVDLPLTTTPWNLIDSPNAIWLSGMGRYGNLSGSLKKLPTDPRISFRTDGTMSYSDDITELVQGWIDGSIPNWGVCLFTDDCTGTIYVGSNSNPNPKNRCLVGTCTGYDSNITKRPRLIIEYEQ